MRSVSVRMSVRLVWKCQCEDGYQESVRSVSVIISVTLVREGSVRMSIRLV